MEIQLNTLRKRASALLGVDSRKLTRKHDGHTFEKLIEEILLHQVALELQSINLLEAQDQLEESNNRYSELYNFAPIAYFTINLKGIITDANSAAAELLGIQKHLLVNRSLSRYIAPESQQTYSAFRQHARKETATTHPFELKLLKRNGALFYADLKGKVLNDPAGNAQKYLIMITDITHYKKPGSTFNITQNIGPYLEHSKIANEFLSIVTNELNHPLGVIGNFVHGCINRLEGGQYDSHQLLGTLKQTVEQLNRTSKILMRIKNFTFKGKLDYENVCINSLIQETLTLISHELNEFDIELNYKINKSLPTITIDKLYIQQVILNLARNAIDALRDNNIDEPKLTIEANQSINNTIEICVIDNGPGFMPGQMHKLFDPHYTTKPYGIGLGLAVSRSIVELHKGTLEAGLNLTYGAYFKITLPIKA